MVLYYRYKIKYLLGEIQGLLNFPVVQTVV